MTPENFAMKLQAALLELPDELKERGLDVEGVVVRAREGSGIMELSVHLTDGTAFMLLLTDLLGPRIRAVK